MYSLFNTFLSIILVSNLVTAVKPYAKSAVSSRKWLTELFSIAERDFNMESAIDPKCRDDFRLYVSHLRNQTVWAVRMKESSEWPSIGVYSGMVDHMGNWAECLRATGPDGIKGKYCIARMVIKDYPSSHDDLITYPPTDNKQWECEECSAWSMLKKCADDPMRAERRIIQWAICLPSSCTVEDLQTSLNRLTIPVFDGSDLSVEIITDSSMCSTSVPHIYPNEYYYSGMVFVCLIALVIASTLTNMLIREKYDETNGCFMKMFKCFSAEQSYRSLIEITEESRNPLYFLKFLYMIMIVVVHRWLFSFNFPLFQTEELEGEYHNGGMLPLTLMNNGADIFFLISGFLLYRLSVDPMRRIGFPYVTAFTVFKMLKTLPAHGLIILFVANILPHLGDGPFWETANRWMFQPCKSRWHLNLIGINNFDSADKHCLIPDWHLAADSQNSLIGIFLLFALTKNIKLGVTLMGLTFIVSAIYTSFVAYSNELCGFIVMGIARTRYVINFQEFNKLYIPFYPRLNPFLLGMTTAFLIEKLKKNNYKFSPILSTFAFLLCLGTTILIQHHGFMLNYETQYPALWKAIFAGFHRPIYVLPYVVLISVYFVSGIGFLDSLFTHKIFFAMGKMSLSMLWCSYAFQMYHASIQRGHVPTSNKLNIYMWSVADIIISLVISFFFYLIADGPFNNLVKLLKMVYVRRFVGKKVD